MDCLKKLSQQLCGASVILLSISFAYAQNDDQSSGFDFNYYSTNERLSDYIESDMDRPGDSDSLGKISNDKQMSFADRSQLFGKVSIGADTSIGGYLNLNAFYDLSTMDGPTIKGPAVNFAIGTNGSSTDLGYIYGRKYNRYDINNFAMTLSYTFVQTSYETLFDEEPVYHSRFLSGPKIEFGSDCFTFNVAGYIPHLSSENSPGMSIGFSMYPTFTCTIYTLFAMLEASYY